MSNQRAFFFTKVDKQYHFFLNAIERIYRHTHTHALSVRVPIDIECEEDKVRRRVRFTSHNGIRLARSSYSSFIALAAVEESRLRKACSMLSTCEAILLSS